MSKALKPPPAPAKSQGESTASVFEQEREFLRYARRHVRGVAWRARVASVVVAVAAVLVTGGVAAFTVLNTLAIRDTVTRNIATEREDLAAAVSNGRDELRQLVAGNVGQAREDAKAFAEMRQSIAKLQATAESLTDAYAVISRDQAQIATALDATRKQLAAAQQSADRATHAADDTQAALARATLPLDQVARIADAQKAAERAVQLARTDLAEIQSALTLVQESKDRGLPRLSAILEEAEVARARIANLAKDAAGLRDAMLTTAQQQSASATTEGADQQAWPERKGRSR